MIIWMNAGLCRPTVLFSIDADADGSATAYNEGTPVFKKDHWLLADHFMRKVITNQTLNSQTLALPSRGTILINFYEDFIKF